MNNNEPIQRFRAGQVEGAIWENKVQVNGQATTILKASVNRRYKDRNGNWQSSQSFSRNEIPLALYVLQKAFEAMVERPTEVKEPKEGVAQTIEEERVE